MPGERADDREAHIQYFAKISRVCSAWMCRNVSRTRLRMRPRRRARPAAPIRRRHLNLHPNLKERADLFLDLFGRKGLADVGRRPQLDSLADLFLATFCGDHDHRQRTPLLGAL